MLRQAHARGSLRTPDEKGSILDVTNILLEYESLEIEE